MPIFSPTHVHRAAEEEQNPHQPQQQQQQLQQQHVRFAHKPPSSSKKKQHVHDSWSSRASSILNNPESIYVSREEVLKNLQNDNHAWRGSSSRTKQEQRSRPKQQQQRHGSWSSRASSILASANQKEPNYMSRAEIIENLADAAYDALSRGRSSTESDSDASTVKSVIMNMKRRDQARIKADAAAKFPPPPTSGPDVANPYSGGDSDTCSCTSCELYYMGDGYCSTCDGDYGGGYGNYDDDNIYGVGGSNGNDGNLTYTKEPSNANKYAAPNRASSKTASIESGGKSAAAGRDKGKRNGSVSSSSNGARANMNNVAEATAANSSRSDRSSYVRKPSSTSSEVTMMKNSSSEMSAAAARKKRFSVSSSVSGSGSNSKKVSSTKTTSAASSFSSRLGGSGGSRQRRRGSQEMMNRDEMDDSKFPPKPILREEIEDEENEAMIYRAVGVGEIQRQRNERVLRRHLRDLAPDWHSRIDDLNTLRRTRVIKGGPIMNDIRTEGGVGSKAGNRLRECL